MAATKSASTVIIGGGRGFVGQALAKHLIQKGFGVSVISRSNQPLPKFCSSLLTWDSLEQNGLPQCSAVVNLAGTNIMFPYRRWSREFKRELYESRVNTTSLLTSLIEKSDNPPEVYVSTSAVGYYPPSSSETYDEESEVSEEVSSADTFSHLCHQWEAAARLSPATPHSHSTRQVTVRTGLVVGRHGGMISYSILPFYLGVGGRLASGDQWLPWIHVQDVVGVYTHAITNVTVAGVLNAVSPGICTNSEFTQAFARALNRPACIPVPQQAIQFIFGSERARLLTEGQKVRPNQTLASGYRFMYTDIDSACREVAHLF